MLNYDRYIKINKAIAFLVLEAINLGYLQRSILGNIYLIR